MLPWLGSSVAMTVVWGFSYSSDWTPKLGTSTYHRGVCKKKKKFSMEFYVYCFVYLYVSLLQLNYIKVLYMYFPTSNKEGVRNKSVYRGSGEADNEPSICCIGDFSSLGSIIVMLSGYVRF